MHPIIMVVAADLHLADSGIVMAGPETVLVCQEAGRVAREYREAVVYATAGYSKKYGVVMGDGPMRECLIDQSIQSYRIQTPSALTFNTDGELQTFVEHVPWKKLERPVEILLVCRAWHLPRAWFLLWTWLRKHGIRNVSIKPVWVKDSEDVRGMLRELLAFPANLLKIVRIF